MDVAETADDGVVRHAVFHGQSGKLAEGNTAFGLVFHLAVALGTTSAVCGHPAYNQPAARL